MRSVRPGCVGDDGEAAACGHSAARDSWLQHAGAVGGTHRAPPGGGVGAWRAAVRVLRPGLDRGLAGPGDIPGQAARAGRRPDRRVRGDRGRFLRRRGKPDGGVGAAAASRRAGRRPASAFLSEGETVPFRRGGCCLSDVPARAQDDWVPSPGRSPMAATASRWLSPDLRRTPGEPVGPQRLGGPGPSARPLPAVGPGTCAARPARAGPRRPGWQRRLLGSPSANASRASAARHMVTLRVWRIARLMSSASSSSSRAWSGRPCTTASVPGCTREVA
jgi:hypothetical protein